MITPSDIVFHLAEYLPRLTDLFSDNIGITTVVSSGGYTLTCDTATAHGLSTSSPIYFKSGKTPNTIASVTEGAIFPIQFPVTFDIAENLLTIEFQDVHDFTTPNARIEVEPLPCVGFNEAVWNVTLDIVSVLSDTVVVVEFPTGATTRPTFTAGAAIGYEERPLSIYGLQTVTSATTTQFIVALDSVNVPPIPDGTLIDVTATTAVRVAAVDNVTRADEIYTKMPDTDDLWAFVIMNDTDVSKDRHTLNDSTASFTHQNEMRLKMLQNFSIVVYFRTAASISGATAQELAYGDVLKALLKSLYGYSGFNDSDDVSDYVAVITGHGEGSSNVAYYTHVYEWQVPVDVNFTSGFQFYDDEAFRSISGTFGMFETDNEEQLTLAITLDP